MLQLSSRQFGALFGFVCFDAYVTGHSVFGNVTFNQALSNTFSPYEFWCLGLFAMLLLVSFSPTARRWLPKTWLLVLSTVLLGLSELPTLVTFSGPLEASLEVCGGAATGWIMMLWGQLFMALDVNRLSLFITGSFLLSSLLCVGIGALDGYAAAALMATAILSGLLCYFAQPATRVVAIVPSFVSSDKRFAIESIAIFLFASATVICSMPSEFAVLSGSLSPSGEITFAQGICCVLIFLVITALIAIPSFSITQLRPTLPLLLAAGALVSLFWADQAFLAYLLALSGRILYQILFSILLPVIARTLPPGGSLAEQRDRALRRFAWGTLSFWLGFEGTYFISHLIWPSHSLSSAMNEALIALLLAILCAIAVGFGMLRPPRAKHSDETADSDETNGGIQESSLDGACALIGEEFGLSPREQDVFRLLARGHSVKSIEETLYISSGTVSSHKQRIYRKLEVHSKQELIDLVEHKRRETDAFFK